MKKSVWNKELLKSRISKILAGALAVGIVTNTALPVRAAEYVFDEAPFEEIQWEETGEEYALDAAPDDTINDDLYIVSDEETEPEYVSDEVYPEEEWEEAVEAGVEEESDFSSEEAEGIKTLDNDQKEEGSAEGADQLQDDPEGESSILEERILTIPGENFLNEQTFTPTESGVYRIYSDPESMKILEGDAYGTIAEIYTQSYDEYGWVDWRKSVARSTNYESGDNTQFSITCELTAGTEYWLNIFLRKGYANLSESGFKIQIRLVIEKTDSYKTITFVGNGGTFSDPDSVDIGDAADTVTIVNDSSAPYLRFTERVRNSIEHDDYERYYLKGWSLEENGPLINEQDVPAESCTLYAVWGSYCWLTLDFNGGYANHTGETFTTVTEIIVPGDKNELEEMDEIVSDWMIVHKSRSKAFMGWSESSSAKEGKRLQDFVINTDVTYYAVWGDGFTVTLDANGGYFFYDPDITTIECGVPVNESFEYKKEVSVNGDIDNYDDTKCLIGWSLNADALSGILLSDMPPVTANVRYYAVWEDSDEVPKYTVTFDRNIIGQVVTAWYAHDKAGGKTGNGVTDNSSVSYRAGESVLEKAPLLDTDCYYVDTDGVYHFFEGWSQTRGGKRILGSYRAEKDQTLYAIWGIYYHVTFNGNGGTINGDKAYSEWVAAGTSLADNAELAAVSADDHLTFSYWSTDKEGKNWVDLESFTVNDNVNLYANWGKLHHVILDANGGYFPVEKQTVFKTAAVDGKGLSKGPASMPVSGATHVQFSNWAYDREGTKPLAVALGDFVPTGDVTLYAIYKTGGGLPESVPIENAAVSGLKDAVYTGKEITRSFTVQLNGKRLLEGPDYTVSYSNNIKVGIAEITITGRGSYSGMIHRNFTIKPKSTKIISVKTGKKKAQVKTKKQTNQVTGYEIKYSTSRAFKTNTKTKTVTSNKKATTTLKKLKAGSTYYIKVRTYLKVGSRKIYSPWSKTMKIHVT